MGKAVGVKTFTLRRAGILFLKWVGAVILVVGLALGGGYWYFHPAVEPAENLVYTQREGRELSIEVIRPQASRGLGIVLVVSGSWKSNPDTGKLWLVAPLLRKGFTVLAVHHLSQPQATIMEIEEDLQRSIRFIRTQADSLGIDPDRIGITGGSSGGHLSLMMVTTGGPGDPEASDLVERESSAVQAAAVFFPVTDLLNLGDSTENPGDGGPPISYVKGFGPEATDMEQWKQIGREISPIYHVNEGQPPVLIFHGNADTLVPVDQSERFLEKATEAGAEVELIVREGKGQGWARMLLDLGTIADWFEENL